MAVQLSAKEWRVFYSLNRLNWLLAVAPLPICALMVMTSSLKLVGGLLPLNVAASFVFGLVFLFYVYVRKDALIVICSNALALTLTFIYSGAVFSYVAAFLGARFPLQDATFAAADRYLGFDWLALLAWTNKHPSLAIVFELAYPSIFVQALVIILALAMFGYHRRLHLLLLATQLTSVVTTIVGATVPAVGAYHFYKIALEDHPAINLPSAAAHVTDLLNLRSAQPQLPFEVLEGIVAFPSFHTVLGILFIWAAWPVRGLKWIALVLNIAMICATPLWGGHYFVDLVAGFVLALVGLFVANAIVVRIERNSKAESDSACDGTRSLPDRVPSLPESLFRKS